VRRARGFFCLQPSQTRLSERCKQKIPSEPSELRILWSLKPPPNWDHAVIPSERSEPRVLSSLGPLRPLAESGTNPSM